MKLQHIITIATALILTVDGTAFFFNDSFASTPQGNVSTIIAIHPDAGK